MAKKGSFSKVYDKNGDYVDVEAARFDGTRTFQMQGDVSATQTWNGDSASALTLNTSIGAKKVTTDKINDKAVQTGQIDDGAVGLTQIATNAMNGTVQDNDSKLATHAAVKTYVDAQISGQGTYLGKKTVAEVNAMNVNNLHNGDRVQMADAGTINLGPGGVGFDVVAGEDLILYKSGSTVQWDTMDGDFKTKQSAVDDPTESGTTITAIATISQNENGEITATKKTIRTGNGSDTGVVKLSDSTSSTSGVSDGVAATPAAVKSAYDLASTANSGLADKQDKPSSATENNIATFNGSKSTKDSGKSFLPSTSTWDGTSDDKVPTAKAVQAQLDKKLDTDGDGKDVTATFTEASTRENIGTGEKLSVIFGKIKKWFTDLGTAAFKNVPASGNASSTEVVLGSDTRLSAGASAVQDVTVDGTSVVNASTKVAAVPNASTSAKGAVQLAGSIGATVASENNKAATEKAVRDALDGKTDLRAVRLTNSDDLNSIANTYSAGTLQVYNWLNTSVPANAPDTLPCTMVQYGIANTSTSKNCVQVVYPRSADFYFERICNSGTWSAWKKVFYEATSTYSSTGTQAVNGTAVASALSSYELLSNKVTSWSSTTTDAHYPSEKLVKDGLDAKADADSVVAIADAFVLRRGQVGQGWYKLAETTTPRANYNINSVFDVVVSKANQGEHRGSFVMSVRYEGTGVVNVYTKSLFSDDWPSDYPIKIVTTKVSSAVLKVELFFSVSPSNTTNAIYSGISISEQNAGNYGGINKKNAWTYTSYTDVAGSAAPESDPTSDKEVVDVDIVARQHNIASPTNNNLVAMDENGLVKDSGKKAADFELVANKVTSVRAASSATDTAYPSEKAVATALAGKASTGNYSTAVGAKGIRLRFLDTANLYDGVFATILNGYGGIGYRNITFAVRRASGSTPSVHRYNTEVSSNDYNTGEIFSVYYGTDPSDGNYRILLIVPGGSIQGLLNFSTAGTASTWSVLYNTPSTTGLTQITPTEHTNVFGANKGSASVPVYVNASGEATPCTDDFVHDADLSAYEQTTNKVSSWQSTPDNTHYPSEKLVKDGLDAKADANKVVAIADAVVSRMGTTGWFKVAERTYNQVTSTAGGTWAVTIISASKNITCHYTIDLNIRAQTSGTNAAVRIFSSSPLGLSASDNYDNFRCVLNGTSGSLTIELWYYAGGAHESMMLSELATGVYNGSNTKFGWTYYNISSSTAGSETAPTGNVVKDIDFVYAQKPVANATSGDFAGLDANGMLTDSGKKAADFATSAQGDKADSAIQGVKVNSTTLTPDANKVVTVPLATTSADGAMSAADKTKLDGIAAGAEANVQADWNETDSSSDAFIKNKPFYHLPSFSSETIVKVCTFALAGESSSLNGESIDVLFRQGNFACIGSLTYKTNAFVLLLKNIGNVNAQRKVVFYYVIGTSNVTIYAKVSDYTQLSVAPKLNLPKARVDFTDFGTTATLPEGATEITPVWVVNSASSSGTAPVKVDAYGALTAVPMDSTPTASSTNLMTSGDIKTALDGKQDSFIEVQTTWVQATIGTETKYYRKIGSVTLGAWYRATAIFVCNFDDGRPGGILEIALRRERSSAGEPTHASVSLFTTTQHGGNIDATKYNIGYEMVDGTCNLYFKATSTQGQVCRCIYSRNFTVATASVSTAPLAYTNIPIYTGAQSQFETATGSASVPIYVDNNGVLTACTDDFVHDAEIAKMVQVETAGTAAGSSLQPVYVNASGVATAGDFSTWNSQRGAGTTINNMPVAWYRSSGNYSVTSGELTQYVEISGLDDFGYIDFWFNIFANNRPFTIHLRINTYASGRKSIELLERSGYDSTHIESVALRVISNNDRRETKIYLKVLYTNGSILWKSTANISNSNFAVLTEQQYNALTTYKINELNITDIGTTARTGRHYQRNYAVLDQGDVKSTYSATGTDPVNGTAVAAAIATSLTDVEYVAAQSGGGGNLNKTKNGSTTSVLAFMTTAEATSLWQSAWAAAN